MFRKVPVCAVVVNIEPLFLGGNIGVGSFEPLVISFNQSVHNLVLCMFFFKETLLNTYIVD